MRMKATIQPTTGGTGPTARRRRSTDEEICQAMYDEGFWDAALPSPLSASVQASEEEVTALCQGFQQIAKPIIANMPNDRGKRRLALDRLVFAGVHAQTSVHFAISRETNNVLTL